MFIGPSYLHCLETMNELSWLPLIATKGMAVASHLNHSIFTRVCVCVCRVSTMKSFFRSLCNLTETASTVQRPALCHMSTCTWADGQSAMGNSGALRDARAELFYVRLMTTTLSTTNSHPNLRYLLALLASQSRHRGGGRAHAQNNCARAKDLLVRRATCGLLEGPGREEQASPPRSEYGRIHNPHP